MPRKLSFHNKILSNKELTAIWQNQHQLSFGFNEKITWNPSLSVIVLFQGTLNKKQSFEECANMYVDEVLVNCIHSFILVYRPNQKLYKNDLNFRNI